MLLLCNRLEHNVIYVYILLMFVMDFLNVICKKFLFERLKLSTPVHNENSSTNDNIE